MFIRQKIIPNHLILSGLKTRRTTLDERCMWKIAAFVFDFQNIIQIDEAVEQVEYITLLII